MQNIRKFNWKLLVLITWLLLGLYFGSGGITKMENYNLIKSSIEQTDTTTVVYKGITFQNKGALLRTLEEEETESIFPWIGSLPSYVSYMITACAFGLLGSIIRLFIQLAIEHKPLETLPIYTLPVLGLLTGLVVLGISLIFPALLFNSDKDIKPSGLMFICLFSGIYVDRLYEGLSNLFTRKFDDK